MSAPIVPILDSHIHLYPASELSSLAWNTPGHPLWAQHSLDEYRRATASSSDILSGFIFVETDRRNDSSSSSSSSSDTNDSYTGPLEEVSFLARIASNRPRPGEGHGHSGASSLGDKDLCLGIIPWAPVHRGPQVLAQYLDTVRDTCRRDGDEQTWAKVKGFRYLLQDKPDGTMLKQEFVDGLRLLGDKRLVFDVGVDLHRRGMRQLEEVVELVERVHEGVAARESKTTFILNHLCKPDLTLFDTSDPSFAAWRQAIFTLSKADNVYMKLSGAFSEMAPDFARTASPDDIFLALSPWLAVVVAAFGPARIMFGSDWPVCTTQELGTEPHNAWDKWRLVVERLCVMSSFSEDETKDVFWGTARRAYRV
ncbi:hypothetical protein BD289DRAFT_368930 [Coniella lustricola]|uniref:Amidohydrolase-related domain-containing protein n=1 Tax=Coniella lustricola TaxID=2025994 RepID=A0A2T3A798_9PEZI|nr:hypothetical protein BD289DRAFT_368930 [Coniella lustricola]